MKFISKYFDIALVLVIILSLTLADFRYAQLVALGMIFSVVNFYLLKWSWSNILKKKLIALSTSVIVIKYSFFVAIIYFVNQIQKDQVSWFLVGFTISLIATVSKHVFLNLKDYKHEELCH